TSKAQSRGRQLQLATKFPCSFRQTTDQRRPRKSPWLQPLLAAIPSQTIRRRGRPPPLAPSEVTGTHLFCPSLETRGQACRDSRVPLPMVSQLLAASLSAKATTLDRCCRDFSQTPRSSSHRLRISTRALLLSAQRRCKSLATVRLHSRRSLARPAAGFPNRAAATASLPSPAAATHHLFALRWSSENQDETLQSQPCRRRWHAAPAPEFSIRLWPGSRLPPGRCDLHQ